MSEQAAPAATVPRPPHHYTEPDWIEVEGLRVAYRRKGAGEATLYLHGAGFTRMWLPFHEPTNMREVLPDFESLAEVEHQFGESATLARLAWNPRFDPKLERRLARVRCPTLVVRAEHDRFVPDEIAERYSQLLPDARLK